MHDQLCVVFWASHWFNFSIIFFCSFLSHKTPHTPPFSIDSFSLLITRSPPILLSFDLHLHPVYCVTSPTKDERYRAPPPTPPGYQGLALGDLGLTDGVVGGPGGPLPRPPHLRPPDYSVALQRSKLLHSPGAASSLADARRLAAANHHFHHQEARNVSSMQGHSRPPSICLPPQELADSEDGMSHRMVLFLRSETKEETWEKVLNLSQEISCIFNQKWKC